MMQAIVENKSKLDQQQQLKSRIIKLNKEKERANKRINDMQFRNKFVTEMHMEKRNR